MIYDRNKAGRMLKVVLDVAEGALDLAARPGGEPSLRLPVMEFDKRMRPLAAKGDVDAMYHSYLRFLTEDEAVGATLLRHRMTSFESEFYRFVRLYRERD